MLTESQVVPTVAQHVESVLGKEGFRYVSTVVANCKMLALELEATEDDTSASIDMEALIIAGYLHDISTSTHGYHDHHLQSAEMAVEFLRELNLPAERVEKVKQVILTHTTVFSPEQREDAPIEGRLLYDADKIGRLSGLAVVTSLIEFGARYPNRAVTGEVLAAILRHIEERFVELYQSLNTAPAREMAQEKFGSTLAFLDGVIEHLSDATPI
ncbi:MAG: HD domain-containing protein [Ktedonobacteraceae bacterium]